ncbi:hypothetical protein HY417_02975 [Candidatus Kaiserbacteria bacterium]|nr:hypothetical protein [Candidatus Kaiserbacteria bacterium]
MDSERGFAPLPLVGVLAVALLMLGGVLYLGISDRTVSPEGTDTLRVTDEIRFRDAASSQTIPPSSASSAGDASKLKVEIQMALTTGGISPTRLASMQREIDVLAGEGVDVSELRALLAELSVGGSEKLTPPALPPPQKAEEERVETKPFWEYDPSRTADWQYWAREGTAPACHELLVLPSPVDLSLVTAILYPGQVRGDGPEDFKPHGGFIFKAGNKSVELRAPMDGYLTAVAKFTDEFGLHYGLTFQHPCGIQFGGGHFGALPPDIRAVVDKVPLKGYGESRTEPILPPYFVKKGQVIVTGLQEKANPDRPGFDWGVADLRQENVASKDPRFRALYGYAPWNTYYGVCWFDLLPPEEEAIVRSFPGGDWKEGKNSEYCK